MLWETLTSHGIWCLSSDWRRSCLLCLVLVGIISLMMHRFMRKDSYKSYMFPSTNRIAKKPITWSDKGTRDEPHVPFYWNNQVSISEPSLLFWTPAWNVSLAFFLNGVEVTREIMESIRRASGSDFISNWLLVPLTKLIKLHYKNARNRKTRMTWFKQDILEKCWFTRMCKDEKMKWIFWILSILE